MCLITEQRKSITLSEDKTVYKVLKKDLKPYYYYGDGLKPYVIGKLNSVRIKRSNDFTYFDSLEGKFLVREFGTTKEQSLKTKGLISIGQGFHSADSPERYTREGLIYDQLLVECTIPKGSKVYLSPTGLVVSNKLIINKIL